MADGGSGWIVISAFIGAATAVLAGVPLEHYRRHRDRRSTAAVIAAEIASLLHVVERHNVIAEFQKLLSVLETGKDIPLLRPYTVKPEFGPIFEKHIDKLGLLPVDISDRTVRFYGYLVGVRATIKNLFEGVWDAAPNPADAKAAQLRASLALWNDMTALAKPLVVDLRKIAAAPWWPIGWLHDFWTRAS